MMEDVIRELSAVTDVQWWGYLFSQDPMFGRVPAQQRAELIARAVEEGVRAAREMRPAGFDGDMEALCEKLDVEIREEASYGTDDYILFASFTEPRLVTLYTGNLDKLEVFLEDNAVAGMPDARGARALLLAHELYHFYEQQHPDCFSEVYRFESHALGFIKLHARLVSLSEIAAMAFAKELTGAAVHPCVLNVLLLLPHDAQKAAKMFRGMQTRMIELE
ncbi:MAG: hypothetical protein VB092_05720 [Oscillospiraceae bacterium]|nr:hypothetical protein [Oscillospiraceae bacterium]